MITIEDIPFDIIYYICRNFIKDHTEIKKLRSLNKYFKSIIPFKSVSILSINYKTSYLYKLRLECITDLTVVGIGIDTIDIPPNIKNLDCSNNKIRVIKNLPPTIKNLKCSNNKVYILEIPYGIETIDCSFNNIRWLRRLPENINMINCSNNLLEVLVIPNGSKKVYCQNNNLSDLCIPNSVNHLECQNNKISQLCIPDSVVHLNCAYNKLDDLIINHKLESISFNGNNLPYHGIKRFADKIMFW